ncbi:hypothetical protein NQZ68_016444 [Dissostichus eleginoides]|nr:hypothetical protein NQZ68_016444 [Dissostichus eleginoides]
MAWDREDEEEEEEEEEEDDEEDAAADADEGEWGCFLLGGCPYIVGNEAVMSYLALNAPAWLNIHGAQAANVHSALHLSVQ